MLISAEWTARSDSDVERLASQYKSHAYALLPEFLTGAGLALVRKEAHRLLRNSGRNIVMGPVIDALSTLIPELYYSDDTLALVRDVIGEEVYPLYEYVDRYLLNALEPGETFGARLGNHPLSMVVDIAGGDAYLVRTDTTSTGVQAPVRPGRQLAFHFAYALHPQATRATSSPVASFTEWDPLEETIVGVASGTAIPRESERMIRSTMPAEWHELFLGQGGQPFPAGVADAAQEELDNLADLLAGMGVVVRRPEALDWSTAGGHTSAMPRDCLLVASTTVIEAPMVWRSRQNETAAYRKLLAGYARHGAVWASAPRTDPRHLESASGRWAINEAAPAFDAADFVRVGHHIVGQLSHVTNRAGVAWLRSFLGADHTVVLLEFDDPHAMHIDATLLPLRPGVILVNPTRATESILDRSPFARWDRIVVENPRPAGRVPRFMTSGWINMNVLSIDERRVIVESHDVDLARQLESRGFDPVPVPFEHVNAIGGSFHCATLDIRRRGTGDCYL